MQIDQTRPASEPGPTFVEGKVTVRTHPAEEEVDTPARRDLGLVCSACFLRFGSIAVEEVDVLGRNVD